MDTQLTNQFLISTRRVFHNMLGMEIVVREPPKVVLNHAPSHFVNAVLNLSGSTEGMVAFGVSRSLAVQLTEMMVDERPKEINGLVVDAMGELINIICGAVRASISNEHIVADIPSIVIGRSKLLNYSPEWQRVTIPLGCLYGDLSIDYAFSKNSVSSKVMNSA